MSTDVQPQSAETSLPADLSVHEAADLLATYRTAPTEVGEPVPDTAESVTEEISDIDDQPLEEESADTESVEEVTEETEDDLESPVDDDADQPENATEEPELYEIEGEEVSLDTIKEWREGGMRQDDYSRKTQVLAQQTQAVGSIEKKLNQFAHASAQMHKGRLSKIEGALKQYQSVDWAKLASDDQQKFTVHKEQFEQLKNQYSGEQRQFAGFLKEFNTLSEQSTAKKAEAAYPEIKQRIKGWNEGRYHELREFLSSKLGADAAQVNQITDPWFWELANDAFTYRSGKTLNTGKRKIRRATKTLKAKAPVKPVDQAAKDEESSIANISRSTSARGQMEAGAALLAQRRGRK